jgi:translation initiation factor IF-3
LAEDAGLDLVEIAPQAKPPVCRIMDYGKYLFEQKKKRQDSKSKQKQVQVKEVKFRPGTEEGDYRVKLRNLTRFLTDGDRAKISLRFRGREITHPELGRKLLMRVADDVAELAVVEQMPRMEGRQMVMMIAPKKQAQSKSTGKAKAKPTGPAKSSGRDRSPSSSSETGAAAAASIPGTDSGTTTNK